MVDRIGRRICAGSIAFLLLLGMTGCLRPSQAPAGESSRVQKPKLSQPAPEARIRNDTVPAASGSGRAVREQLEETQEQLATARAEVERLRADHAELSQAIEKLEEDNRALDELLATVQEERDGIRAELDAQSLRLTEMELRYRTLADDLLLERIARVRTERELVQARIDREEASQDG